MDEKKEGRTIGAEVIAACPAMGRSSVLTEIKKLVDERTIVVMGNGRSTFYVRSDAVRDTDPGAPRP